MTEYAHNHPPRCCCISGWVDKPDTPCPLCPEHGELAQLGNTCVVESARIHSTDQHGNAHLTFGEGLTLDPYTERPECSNCHQPQGRPHTEYCGTGGIVGAEPIPNPLGMTYDPQTHTTPDGDTHPVHQCHPDRCGMWATHTTQPASQTSQPTTQARTGPPAYTLNEDGTTNAATQCVDPQCNYPNPHTHPDLVAPRRTPLATPTPGHCPSCERDADEHPSLNCQRPDWHDHPR